MYFYARVRRMVWYGLSDHEISKSLDLTVAEVRGIIQQMDPPPIKVLDETGKVIQERLYLS